ncbi:DUF6082 family protein [Actinomycetota bacterium Odt1-20B]
MWSLALGLVTLVLVGCTPLLLQWASSRKVDWGKLSEISQAYSAVSVVFSGVALWGVALSIAYQVRQTKMGREEVRRSAHRELLFRALDDPSLVPCWEPPRPGDTPETWRRLVYTNLIMVAWEADYRNRRRDDALRQELQTHFTGEIARLHWERGRDWWRTYARAEKDKAALRFVEIADDAYRSAVVEGPAVPAADYFTRSRP